MTKEEAQKAILADCLTEYINERHTQEECTGFIDGFKKALEELSNPISGEDECKHPRHNRTYVGQGLLHCELCDKTFQ